MKKKENPIGQVIKGSLLHSQEPRGLLSSDDLSKFEIISTTWWIVIHRLDDVGKATYLFFQEVAKNWMIMPGQWRQKQLMPQRLRLFRPKGKFLDNNNRVVTVFCLSFSIQDVWTVTFREECYDICNWYVFTYLFLFLFSGKTNLTNLWNIVLCLVSYLAL